MSDLTDLSWDLGKVATPSLRFLGLFGNALADVQWMLMLHRTVGASKDVKAACKLYIFIY